MTVNSAARVTAAVAANAAHRPAQKAPLNARCKDAAGELSLMFMSWEYDDGELTETDALRLEKLLKRLRSITPVL